MRQLTLLPFYLCNSVPTTITPAWAKLSIFEISCLTPGKPTNLTMSDTLSSRVALITGAGRGIGAAAAVELARLGFIPVLAVRDTATAVDVCAQLTAAGYDHRLVRCDVADFKQAQDAVDTALKAFGRLDVLVNNAATVDPIARLADSDPAAWARAIQVNLTGPYNLARAALQALMASPCPALINVSTGAAHAPREGWSAYCSSKAGLVMLTRAIDLEMGPGAGGTLHAYGFQPGLVDTAMQVRIRASGINDISRIPRSQLAPPERAARVIAWLAHARPSDLVGQDLTIRDAKLLERAGLSAS
jgi:NAD(P)-dependent dehydrogenase (short-subunit alcohol dehydrogenase family)